MTSGRLTIAAVVAIGLMIGPASAAAQSQITLGGSTTSVIFQGTSSTSTLAVTLGGCSKAGACTIGGQAFGTGSLTSGPAPYAITSTLGTITLTLVNAAAGLWDFAQSSKIGFGYGPGGSLLTGTLQLVNLSQTPGFNLAVANADLTVTGGSLASVLQAGLIDVTIRFGCKTNLESMLGTNGHLNGKISSGELVPTPEPSSMLLLGSGLLAAGSMLRFLKRTP